MVADLHHRHVWHSSRDPILNGCADVAEEQESVASMANGQDQTPVIVMGGVRPRDAGRADSDTSGVDLSPEGSVVMLSDHRRPRCPKFLDG